MHQMYQGSLAIVLYLENLVLGVLPDASFDDDTHGGGESVKKVKSVGYNTIEWRKVWLKRGDADLPKAAEPNYVTDFFIIVFLINAMCLTEKCSVPSASS